MRRPSWASVSFAACGMSEPATFLNSGPTWAMPLAAMTPNSAAWPRTAFTSCVRCRTSRSRARNTTPFACCSSLLTGTKRMLGLWTASQIASASAVSFFRRFTNGLTQAGGTSRIVWPSFPISRAQ